MLKSVEGALKRRGYTISFLLRFAAFFPYMILNYGLALTCIRPSQYMFGFFGGWPWEALIVYYGYCVGDVISILDGSYKSCMYHTCNLRGVATSHNLLLLGTICFSLCVGAYIVSFTFKEIRRLNEPILNTQHVEMIEERYKVEPRETSAS